MHRQRGFNLIELMTVVAIVSILVVIGLPSVSDWIENSRTRSVAESLQNGIRFAQGEAARLSRLTTLATTSNTWTVKYVQITGGNDTVPTTLQQSPAGNLDFVTITPNDAQNTVLQFNDLGRVKSASTEGGTFATLVSGDATGDATFLIANSKGTRKLSVRVSPSGKVRMCDPDRTFNPSSAPDGC